MNENTCQIDCITNINDWFYKQILNINYSNDVKGYITGVLKNYVNNNDIDFSDKSIILTYYNAKNFSNFQNLGDWILYTTIFNRHCFQNDDIAFDIGQSCYYMCNIFISERWPVYKDLSQNLKSIVVDVRDRFDFKHNEK